MSVKNPPCKFVRNSYSMNKKVSVARLSVASNTLLIALKLTVGLLSGSVSIISEAIHSLMDLVAAVIAFFAVRVSDIPADERHPYGHGKFENVSGVIEALLIVGAAVWIVVEAIHKIENPGEPEFVLLGATVMLVSAVVNYFVSRKLYKVAKETDSVALEADALHLKTDVYTSLGVGLGLLLLWITGIPLIDPIIAILVALLILWESFQLLKKAFTPLLDVSLDESEVSRINEILAARNLKYHDLKTRKAGNYRFVEFHLELPAGMVLAEVHRHCDDIEEILKTQLEHLTVTIHVEPVGKA